MFCFEILRIYGEKSQKNKTGNLGISPMLQRRESMPRHKHCSQQANFLDFCFEGLVFVCRLYRNPNK